MARKSGYAVFDGEIFTNSVHDTKQGAMVNGLLLCFGIICQQSWDYHTIRGLWKAKAESGHFRIVEVVVATEGKAVEL